jgi:hypothetical protein
VLVGDTLTLLSPAADALPAGSIVAVGATSYLRGNDGRWRDDEGIPLDAATDRNPLGRLARIGYRAAWTDLHIAVQRAELSDVHRELLEIDAALGLLGSNRDRYVGDRLDAIRELVRRAAK